MGPRLGTRPVAGLLAATLLFAPAVHAQEDAAGRLDPSIHDESIYDETVYSSPRVLCPCVGPTRGSVLIAGGGELPPEIYQTFVRLAGRNRAHIVVIPTAGDLGEPRSIDVEGLRAAGASS